MLLVSNFLNRDAHVRKMAKSIRSKRERKKRAAKRKKLKPKVIAKLEETLGLKDKEMAVDEETKEAEGSEEPLVKVVGNQESTVVGIRKFAQFYRYIYICMVSANHWLRSIESYSFQFNCRVLGF